MSMTGSSTPEFTTSSSDESSSEPTLPQPKTPKIEFSHIVSLMADEIGVDPAVITDEVLLPDLGVDSLMQISITSKIKAYVPDPLPDTLLLHHNSIAKLRAYFQGKYGL